MFEHFIIVKEMTDPSAHGLKHFKTFKNYLFIFRTKRQVWIVPVLLLAIEKGSFRMAEYFILSHYEL